MAKRKRSVTRTRSGFTFTEVVAQNGGLKAGGAYYIEGEYHTLRRTLKRRGVPASTLRSTPDKKGCYSTAMA